MLSLFFAILSCTNQNKETQYHQTDYIAQATAVVESLKQEAKPIPEVTPTQTPTPTLMPTPISTMVALTPTSSSFNLPILSWHGKNKDSDEWTAFIINEISKYSSLVKLNPKDAQSFCKNFDTLGYDDRVVFYASIIAEIAKWESNFRTGLKYYECSKTSNVYGKSSFKDPERGWCMAGGHKLDGGFVVSRGLLQISLASGQGYKCDLKTPDDLHDSKKNLACGALIFSKLVTQDNQIMGKNSAGKWAGASRYWAVTRGDDTKQSVLSIRKSVKNNAICN